jgi:RimJ/RimL family protein N-acetyltransferase
VADSEDKRPSDKYSVVVKLLDGTSVRLRAIRRDDKYRLLAFVARLSKRSRYLRFHHYISGLTEAEAEHFCNVDYHDSMALVAVIKEDSEENIIAVGRYYRYPGTDRAEVAFVVQDKYQGKGIATHLLDRLMVFARERGVDLIEALVLQENNEMQEVFQHRGFRVSEYLEDSVIKMCLDLNNSSGAVN